jgi:hypothetical protein
MTEFEKISLLYMAHQSAMLNLIAVAMQKQMDVNDSNRIAYGEATRDLQDDVRKVGSPETMKMLYPNRRFTTLT